MNSKVERLRDLKQRIKDTAERTTRNVSASTAQYIMHEAAKDMDAVQYAIDWLGSKQ